LEGKKGRWKKARGVRKDDVILYFAYGTKGLQRGREEQANRRER